MFDSDGTVMVSDRVEIAVAKIRVTSLGGVAAA
jgi:hypothetical protein